MSKRITPKWTKTTEEAFGSSEQTRKGLFAEKLILQYLESVYDEVTWYEDNREKQVAGIDFEFKKNIWANYYTADVKGNLKNGYFYVFPDEMRKKKNHRMIHVDVESGRAVEYDRCEMLKFLDSTNITPTIIDNKQCFRLDAWSVKKSNQIEFFRVFNLKKFKPETNKISKALDKYEPVDL